MQFTQEQILKLAPDDASAKAGQQLANSAKWVVKCSHEKALWGDCHGSGKTPYKTIIDLNNLAFKCTCPSRKFPCKHGIGLLLLFTNNKDVFSQESEMAPHVEDWIGKRQVKTETVKEQKPVDEKAQQKRIDARKKKIDSGVEELRLWLKDNIRTGIAGVPQNIYNFNQNIIARMVDSQAGGLANELRKINKIDFFREGWQKSLTKQLAKIYLLTEAYQNRASFPDDLNNEINSLIGWNSSKEEVLSSQTSVQDEWVVLSINTEAEGNLHVEMIWLYGRHKEQFGLILNFYVGNQLPQNLFVVGMSVVASVVFFPSIYPMRMLVKEQFEILHTFEEIEISEKNTVNAFFEKITRVFAQNPFVDKIPSIVQSVKIVYEGDDWYIVNQEKQAITIHNPMPECWKILSISKAKPFSCFGIYENETFEIHAIWCGSNYYFIK